jgi:hypothetical protein
VFSFARRSTFLVRMCVAVLALGALTAPAFAQGGSNGGGGSAPDPEHGRSAPTDPPRAGAASESHVLVAPLRFAAAGTLVIDGGRIDVPSPWSDYLAPGMWLRLEGSWVGTTFRVERLDVARPAFFSYYLGPASPLGLGSGWVEAWFAADTAEDPPATLTVRRTVQEGSAQALVRAVDGHWVALPQGLAPPPVGADGWRLFAGRSVDGDVHWESSQPFP